MSYELLRGLYYGQASNADLTSSRARRLLHLETPLQEFVEDSVDAGRDVVLTGNPGDGKSHLVRTLVDEGVLTGAVVQLDLSARSNEEVLEEWNDAVSQRRSYVLCANEGPLKELLCAAGDHPVLRRRAAELRGQLGRLLVSEVGSLPGLPATAVLVDLADRNVLDESLLTQALTRVATLDFVPGGIAGLESPVGRNIRLLRGSETVRSRLASLIATAGRRLGGHTTFRAMWQTISYALCGDGGASGATVGSPLDNLCSGHGRGHILGSAASVDPARVPSPDLDEDLWNSGEPRTGRWLVPTSPRPAPARLWDEDPGAALGEFQSLKRMVALAHEEGEWLVASVQARAPGVPRLPDEEMKARLIEGVRRLYLSKGAEQAAGRWLVSGLPLWVGHSYARRSASSARPHVVVRCLPAVELEVRWPVRPDWLGGVMGPPPPLVWLAHPASGVALAVTPALWSMVEASSRSEGPIEIPQVVERFLARLSGWIERSSSPRSVAWPVAVLERPRGELVVVSEVEVLEPLGGRYVR